MGHRIQAAPPGLTVGLSVVLSGLGLWLWGDVVGSSEVGRGRSPAPASTARVLFDPSGAASAAEEIPSASSLGAPVTTAGEMRAFVEACERVGPSSLPRLRSLAAQDEDPLVTRHALFALGRLGAGLDGAVLARLTDERASVRQAAVRAVGDTGGRAAIPHLEVALADEDATTRRLAMLGLGALDGSRARALLEHASAGADEEDRAFLREALR